jgi:hypothetical protein
MVKLRRGLIRLSYRALTDFFLPENCSIVSVDASPVRLHEIILVIDGVEMPLVAEGESIPEVNLYYDEGKPCKECGSKVFEVKLK